MAKYDTHGILLLQEGRMDCVLSLYKTRSLEEYIKLTFT